MVVEPNVDRAFSFLHERLGDRLQRDFPLASLTTYRVGGSSAMFVEIRSLADLAVVGEAHVSTGVPVLAIGRGSNMLIADNGFAGVAISLAGLATEIDLPASVTPGAEAIVRAGGAVALPMLARRTAAAGITGFEWAVGVPGSIGGAIRMNAGGHGSDLAACLIDVDAFDLASPELGMRHLEVDQIGLRFRASSLPPLYVVVDARLKLAGGDRATAEREISEIVRWRRENQPGGQNCGSVFVNPVPGEVTAGGLIDGLGLRGARIGTASVSEKHANFIQASERGSAADVRALIEMVRTRVAEQTGYLLRSEVRLVGFDDADPLSFAESTPPETGPFRIGPSRSAS
jgi:UDP-N-acetylmuramate dehydrogenase